MITGDQNWQAAQTKLSMTQNSKWQHTIERVGQMK